MLWVKSLRSSLDSSCIFSCNFFILFLNKIIFKKSTYSLGFGIR